MPDVASFENPDPDVAPLFEAVELGSLTLRNRIVMADPGDPPLSPGQPNADPPLAGREPLPGHEQLSAAALD